MCRHRVLVRKVTARTLRPCRYCGNRTSAIQEIPYYYGDNLEEIPTTLLANPSGTGNKKSCESIEGTILLDPESNSLATMFSVLY